MRDARAAGRCTAPARASGPAGRSRSRSCQPPPVASRLVDPIRRRGPNARRSRLDDLHQFVDRAAARRPAPDGRGPSPDRIAFCAPVSNRTVASTRSAGSSTTTSGPCPAIRRAVSHRCPSGSVTWSQSGSLGRSARRRAPSGAGRPPGPPGSAPSRADPPAAPRWLPPRPAGRRRRAAGRAGPAHRLHRAGDPGQPECPPLAAFLVIPDDVPAPAEGHQAPGLQPPRFGRRGGVLAVVEVTARRARTAAYSGANAGSQVRTRGCSRVAAAILRAPALACWPSARWPRRRGSCAAPRNRRWPAPSSPRADRPAPARPPRRG